MAKVREHLQQATMITNHIVSFWTKFVSMISIDHE